MRNSILIFILLFFSLFCQSQTVIPASNLTGNVASISLVADSTYLIQINTINDQSEVNYDGTDITNGFVFWQNCKRYIVSSTSCGTCFRLATSVKIEVTADNSANGPPSFGLCSIVEENSNGIAGFISGASDPDNQCIISYYLSKQFDGLVDSFSIIQDSIWVYYNSSNEELFRDTTHLGISGGSGTDDQTIEEVLIEGDNANGQGIKNLDSLDADAIKVGNASSGGAAFFNSSSEGQSVNVYSSATPLTPSGKYYKLDATSNNITINLSALSGVQGRNYIFYADNVDNTITIDPNSSETIGGNTTYVFTEVGECIEITATLTGWDITNKYLPSSGGSGDDVSAFSDGLAILGTEKLVSPDSLYSFNQLLVFLDDSIGVASISYDGSTLTLTRKDGSTATALVANVVSGSGAPIGAPGTGQRIYLDTSNEYLYYAVGSSWILLTGNNIPISDLGGYFINDTVEGSLQEAGAITSYITVNNNVVLDSLIRSVVNDGDSIRIYLVNGDSIIIADNAGTTDTVQITQISHGFTLGQMVAYDTIGADRYVLAKTDSVKNIPVAFVYRVIDANSFAIATKGILVNTHGLTVNQDYWLNDSGGFSTTPDTDRAIFAFRTLSATQRDYDISESFQGTPVDNQNATEVATSPFLDIDQNGVSEENVQTALVATNTRLNTLKTAKAQNASTGALANTDIVNTLRNKKKVVTLTASSGVLMWDVKRYANIEINNLSGLVIDALEGRQGGEYKITVKNTSASTRRSLAFSPRFYFPEGFIYLSDIGAKNTYIFKERSGILECISQPDKFPFYYNSEFATNTVLWFSGWQQSKNYKNSSLTNHLISENDSLIYAGNLAGKRHGFSNSSSSRRAKLKLRYNSASFKFDGTDDFFAMDSIKADAKPITETGVFTIILRYLPGATASRYIFDSANGTTNNIGIECTQLSTGQVNMSGYVAAAGQRLYNRDCGFLGSDGYWYAIIKGTGDSTYVRNSDGTWTGAILNASAPLTSAAWSNKLFIAARANTSTYFDGYISDLIFMTSEISEDLVRSYLSENKRVDYTYLSAGVSESSTTGLIFDYNFSDTTNLKKATLSGNSATTIGDTISYVLNDGSLIGRNLNVTTTGARPTLQQRNGKYVARFDGSNDFFNVPTNDFYDGGGTTILMVIANTDSTATRYFLGSTSSTNYVRWYGDSTATASALYEKGYQTFNCSGSNGVSGVNMTYRHSIRNLYERKDSFFLVEIISRDPIHEISLNGHPLKNAKLTYASSYAYVGKHNTGSTFKGDIGRVMMFNRVLSDEQLLYQRKQLARQFNMTLVDTSGIIRYDAETSIQDPESYDDGRKNWKTPTFYADTLNAGGTASNDFYRWPSVQMQGDTLYHYQSIGQDHSTSESLHRFMKYVEGEDGYYETEVSDVNANLINSVVNNFGFMGSDTIINYKNNAADHLDSLIFRDRNFNRYFSLKFDRTISGLDTFFLCASKPFQAKNGVWYLAGYSNTSNYTGRIVRSTNRGRTWTSVASWAGDGSTFRPEEPCIVQGKQDTLIAFIRSDKGAWIWVSRSADGITWSTPVKKFRGGNHPQAIVTTGDSVLVVTPSRYQAYLNPDGTLTDIGEYTSVENTTLKNIRFYTSVDCSWDNGYTWHKYVFDRYRGDNWRFSQEGADVVELSPGYVRLFASAGVGYWIPSSISDLSYWDFVVGSREGDFKIIKR